MNIVKRALLIGFAALTLTACAGDPDLEAPFGGETRLTVEAKKRIGDEAVKQVSDIAGFENVKVTQTSADKDVWMTAKLVGQGCTLGIYRTGDGRLALITKDREKNDNNFLVRYDRYDDSSAAFVTIFTTLLDLKGRAETQNCDLDAAVKAASSTASQTTPATPTN